MTEEICEIPGYTGCGLELTLENFFFATSADIALAVPGGSDLRIKGENRLEVNNSSPYANAGVLYAGGDLTIDGTERDSLTVCACTQDGLWSRRVCARNGNLTVNGGVITAKGGQSKRSCGLYAGGRLWIEIGEKGVILLNRGKVLAEGGSDSIRAAEGKLLFPISAKVENAVNMDEFVRDGDMLRGDCLTAVDQSAPVVVTMI